MQESALDKIIARIAAMSLAKVSFFAALVMAAYYFLLYDDGAQIESSIVALQAQLATEESKKALTTKALRKEEQMRADVALMAKKFEEVRSHIPIDFSETELRLLVENLVQKHGLKTIKNKRSDAGKAFLNTPEAALVEQILLEYTFLGSFNNIFRFAQELSSLEKIVRISNFAIIPDHINPDFRSQEVSFSVILIGFKQVPIDSKRTSQAVQK